MKTNNEVKEDRKPTDDPLFVIGYQIYIYNGKNLYICMPLTANNKLQSIHIRFGSSDNHSQISFASHIDSCAAMDLGNIRIHQWVITTP